MVMVMMMSWKMVMMMMMIRWKMRISIYQCSDTRSVKCQIVLGMATARYHQSLSLPIIIIHSSLSYLDHHLQDGKCVCMKGYQGEFCQLGINIIMIYEHNVECK